MSFQMRGLDAHLFHPHFDLPDEGLAAMGATRMVVDQDNAFPCRIALDWVKSAEPVLLLNHIHQPTASSPYRASGPIFVSRNETGHYRAELAPILKNRLLSLRAYDAGAFIIDAEVGEGDAVLASIERFFANPDVAHIDAHFARRGCFAARIERL